LLRKVLRGEDKKSNLAPGAFWVGGSQFEAQYGKGFLKNKDLDGDGMFETVLRYVALITVPRAGDAA